MVHVDIGVFSTVLLLDRFLWEGGALSEAEDSDMRMSITSDPDAIRPRAEELRAGSAWLGICELRDEWSINNMTYSKTCLTGLSYLSNGRWQGEEDEKPNNGIIIKYIVSHTGYTMSIYSVEISPTMRNTGLNVSDVEMSRLEGIICFKILEVYGIAV